MQVLTQRKQDKQLTGASKKAGESEQLRQTLLASARGQLPASFHACMYTQTETHGGEVQAFDHAKIKEETLIDVCCD
jgi:hypothetical protein